MRGHFRSLFPPLALPSSGSDGRLDSNVEASQPGSPSSRKTRIQLLLAAHYTHSIQPCPSSRATRLPRAYNGS